MAIDPTLVEHYTKFGRKQLKRMQLPATAGNIATTIQFKLTSACIRGTASESEIAQLRQDVQDTARSLAGK